MVKGHGSDEVEGRRAGQRAPKLSVGLHARATGSILAAALLAEISLKNNLGTPRPPHLLPAVDPHDPNTIYFIPSKTAVDGAALKVTYYRTYFRINLFGRFKSHNLLPPAGFRDSYPLRMSPTPVRAGDLTGYALMLKINDKVTEPIRTSEATKSKRQAVLMEREARRERIVRDLQAKVDALEAMLKGK